MLEYADVKPGSVMWWQSEYWSMRMLSQGV